MPAATPPDEIFSWEDEPGTNRVRVSRAGPVDLVVLTGHGPTSTVVKLPRDAVVDLARAINGHVDDTRAVAVVADVLRLHMLPAATVTRTAVQVVEALRTL